MNSAFFTFIFIILNIFSLQTFAKENILKSVEAKRTNDVFTTQLVFNEAVSKDQVKLEYINETIQVNLSNVVVENSRIHNKVTDDKVKSIYTYQTDPGSTRSRIILNAGFSAADFKDKVDLVFEGNKLTVNVKNESFTAIPEVPVTDEDLAEATQWAEGTAVAAKKNVDAKPVENKNTENLKETEIPVLTTKNVTTKEVKPVSMARIMLSLGLVGALLLAGTVYLKRLTKKSPKNKVSQIKVLTQHYLGPRKSLAIIRVAGESILVGITDQNISLIKTLALLDEEIPQDTPSNFQGSFDAALNNTQANDETPDEFSFSKVKDFVSGKLKNMKEL